MPAYLVVQHIIADPVKFEEYRTKVGRNVQFHVHWGGADIDYIRRTAAELARSQPDDAIRNAFSGSCESLQLIGNFVDARLRALVVLSGCAGNADRADDFIAHFDR